MLYLLVLPCMYQNRTSEQPLYNTIIHRSISMDADKNLLFWSTHFAQWTMIGMFFVVSKTKALCRRLWQVSVTCQSLRMESWQVSKPEHELSEQRSCFVNKIRDKYSSKENDFFIVFILYLYHKYSLRTLGCR